MGVDVAQAGPAGRLHAARSTTRSSTEQRAVPGGGEKHPEVAAERVWEAILKKLLQKDYKFDAGFFGSLNEFSRKVAYFFHASLQGTACYPGAADALRHVADARPGAGVARRRPVLHHGAAPARPGRPGRRRRPRRRCSTDGLRVLSCEVRGRKPSERLFRQALDALAEQRHRARPGAARRLAHARRTSSPARRLGMRTALFAGDKASLQATPEQLKEPASRPDVLLTELSQIAEVVG